MMEEVDSIIIHFLKQLNIEIDHEKIKNICDLPVETIIEAASKCLSTINKSLKMPTKLPPGISQRIEVAAQIASMCKDLGYKNDVGYQTFLYYNEAELRQVFMFLIERLPNENIQTVTHQTQTNNRSELMCNIKSKIKEQLNTVWVPPCCISNNHYYVGDHVDAAAVLSQKANHNLLSDDDVIDKILKMHSSKDTIAETGTKEHTFYTENPQTETFVEEKMLSKTIYDDKSLKEMKEMAIVLKQKLDIFKGEKNEMEVEYSQMLKKYEKTKAEMKNVEEILRSIGVTDMESDSVADSLEKLQISINKLHRTNEELTSKTMALRDDIDKLKKTKFINESERNRCKNILISLKESAKAMKEEYQKKQESKEQLINSYEKLKGGNKRYIYTKRIMEIISNVDKQNIEIRKILEDTRQLQKEINMLEGQLDRCFSIADETLFKDAKKDDQAKKAYKLLALLHSECNTIVTLVNDTGSLEREIVDLQDNIETEKAKKTEETLKKILIDLSQMQKESKISL